MISYFVSFFWKRKKIENFYRKVFDKKRGIIREISSNILFWGLFVVFFIHKMILKRLLFIAPFKLINNGIAISDLLFSFDADMRFLLTKFGCALWGVCLGGGLLSFTVIYLVLWMIDSGFWLILEVILYRAIKLRGWKGAIG